MSTGNPDAEFQRRLRLIMQQFGSVADLARAVGVSDNAIYKWVAGRGQPSMTSLVNLAKAAGVSVEWLATGSGIRIRTNPVAGATAGESKDSLEWVKQTAASVHTLQGDEAFASGQGAGYLKFSPGWLRRMFGAEPHDLMLAEVIGDSMSPTVKEGDVVLADVRERDFRAEGIYLLRSGADLQVKRLQRRPDGVVLVRSDNPAYEPLAVRLETLDIVGHVRWIGARL